MAGPRGSLKVIVTALIVLLVVLVGIFGYLNARGEKLKKVKSGLSRK